MPDDVHLFGRLGIGPVDIGAVPEHRLVDPVGAAHLVARHPAKLNELHVVVRIHVRRPGSALLQNANPVRPGHALVLLAPALGELLELSVAQSLAERNDAAGSSRVQEEVARVLGGVLRSINIRQKGLYG